MDTGIQISSLAPILKTEDEVKLAFRHVAALTSVVQLQWVGRDVPVETIRDSLLENHLRCVSVQEMYGPFSSDRRYYLDLMRASASKWLCLSRLPADSFSGSGLDEMTEELKELSTFLGRGGMRLCYHPGAEDLIPSDGKCRLDGLLEALPELDLCLDLFHVWRAGRSIPETIKQYPGRVCMVHFKDGIRYADPETGEEKYRQMPVGCGSVDYRGAVEACLEAGIPYAFAEQEQWEGDPYEKLDASLCFLYSRLEHAKEFQIDPTFLPPVHRVLPYGDLSGLSGVEAYERGEEYIDVKFKNSDMIYRYSYLSCGREAVEHMLHLAYMGRGLSGYISRNVNQLYESKRTAE